MECMWPEKIFALAQIMCSSNILPFLIDLLQELEMIAIFGFGTGPKRIFWNSICEHKTYFTEMHCLRQTVSSISLGKAKIDVEFLSEELQKRISYCKTVWGMALPEKRDES
jgi:hypothetical protein